MISVCLATYNGSSHIKRQLESIIVQLSPNDEVVISDDHSTDDTIKIINEFNDPRIRIILNPFKKGPVNNFQNSLLNSSGNLIFLSDQDDVWLPNKVKIICELLQRNDLIVSDCEVLDAKGELIMRSFFYFRRSRQGIIYNLFKNSYVGCCMAFRREILSYILPFPKRIHMHDWWIGLSVEIRGKVYFHPEPLVQYIRHGNNFSPTGEVGYSLLTKLKNRFLLVYALLLRQFFINN